MISLISYDVQGWLIIFENTEHFLVMITIWEAFIIKTGKSGKPSLREGGGGSRILPGFSHLEGGKWFF